jgi:uncharacterized delta-60 repeat protein
MRRTALTLAAAVAIISVTATAAAALTVKPDQTFSGDGVAALNVRGDDFSLDVVADGDRYYLVGGTRTSRDAECSFLVARYTNAGRLDATWGNEGVRTLRLGKTSCATSGAIAADGGLLVGGWSATREDLFAISAKFGASGNLVRSYGRDGVARVLLSGGIDSPRVEAEPDGSSWLTWSVIKRWNAYTGNYQIAHLTPAGRLDTSFGRQGIRTVDVNDVDALGQTTVDSTGRLYISGWSARAEDAPGAIAIISADDGAALRLKTLNPFDRRGSYPVSIDVDSSDRVVVGMTPSTAPGWGAMRLTSDLRLDSTYAGDGVAKHDCQCWSGTGTLTDDGLVLVGGTGERDDRTVVVRFGVNGAWDREAAQFGPWQAVPDGWENWWAADVDDAGRVVIAGSGKVRGSDALIARLTLS